MNGTNVRVGFCATIVLLLFFAAPVMADRTALTIEPGTLQDVLEAYSQATGTKTVYLNELVEGKKSSGAQNAAPDNALQQILQGTGLTFQMADNNTVVLKPNENKRLRTEEKTDKSAVPQALRDVDTEEMVVTVTANKMEDNINDIPQSITVMTDVDIEERGIDRVSDLIEYIPNINSVTIPPVAAATINFRGINYSTFTNSSPVTIYVDGVPYTHMLGIDKAISNVLRVEVLRGPQGTLYGKDSMGGVINIITKEPLDIAEGSIKVEYGSDNYQEVPFDISAPLIDDKLYLGINGVYSQGDGWVTNHYPGQRKDANEEERYLGNIKLLYKPTDNISIKFNASREGDTRYGMVGGMVPTSTNIHSYERDDFKDASYDQDTYFKNKSASQALHVDCYFSDFTFSSLTTHNKTTPEAYYDKDGSFGTTIGNNYNFIKFETRNIAQEFRLSSDGYGLRWVVGLYFENQKEDNFVGMKNTSTDYSAISEIKSDTVAGFGQIIVPFWEDYELTLGGRYQRIRKNIDLETSMLNVATGNALLYYAMDEDKIWNTFLPKVALSYKINNDLNTYFSITRGYLAGGFNYNASADVQNNFDAQKSTNYELGVRGNLLNNSLYLSAAIFYMNMEDLHVYSTDPQSGARVTSNAAEAYSQGIELELEYAMNDNLRINTSLGVIQSKYDDYVDASGNDFTENKMQNTPQYVFNVGVSYFSNNGIYGRLDIKNQGKTYFNSSNTNKENSYTTANIKVGYLFNNFDIYTYINNIADESYLTGVNDMGMGYNSLTFGNPRFIGVGARYAF